MKSIFIKTTLVLVVFGIILSCNCDSTGNGGNTDKLDSIKIENIELIEKINELVKAMESAPIGKRVNNHMIDNFFVSYIGEINKNRNCPQGTLADQVQKDSFTVSDTPDFKISIADLQNSLEFDFNNNFDSDEGLLFCYLLRPEDGQARQYYFSYAIIRATRNHLDSLIQCAPVSRYIVFDKTTFSTTTNYAPFINNYNSRVVSKDFYPCIRKEAVNVGNLPRSCFYYFSDLKKFYNHNVNIQDGISNLNIINAAVTIQNGLSAQVPMLRWGNASGPIDIDNNYNHADGYYHKKAMDVGHLCPPDCSNPAPLGCNFK